MSKNRSRARRCLILTPATRWGSWSWLEKVIAASDPTVEWVVVSYGRPPALAANMRVFALPAVNYASAGRYMSRRPWWFMNLLYYLPLAPLAWIAALITRPNVLVGNGIIPALLLQPLKLGGARLVLTYHGYSGHVDNRIRAVLRILLRSCDAATVNSQTSLDDLSGILDPRKITLVPHSADDLFFRLPLTRPPRDRVVVLFVGRLDGEKFAQCLRVARALSSESVTELWAVGGGPLAKQVDEASGRWFGYVQDRHRLAAIFAEVDIVWAPADATYLSLPGVEALAAGCPVIVSDVPAVEVRAKAGFRIPGTLIPPDVGYVVDGKDDAEVMNLLRFLAREGIPRGMREACRSYALLHHGPENVQLVVKLLFRAESENL